MSFSEMVGRLFRAIHRFVVRRRAPSRSPVNEVGPAGDVQSVAAVVAGTSFEGRAEVIRSRCEVGQTVFLVREPNNQHDPNAISVWIMDARGKTMIGYVKAARAASLAHRIDSGEIVWADSVVRSFSALPGMHAPRVSLTIRYRSGA